MSVRLQSLIVVFHKAHVENLVAMVVGIAYARRVSLPAIAGAAPLRPIQIEGRVQRFERLLGCRKFVPLEVLQPIATRLLRSLGRQPGPLLILMDRSMINDTLNLLHLSVAYGGRALPLGWVRVPHDGTSDLALQQRLLLWLKPCLPRGVEVFIVADREFHSVHLAQWIAATLPCHFVLRLQANTWVEVGGQWHKAGALARRGERHFYGQVRVTRDRRATQRVNLAAIWEATQDEPWLLMSDAEDLAQIAAVYGKRYGIEEMFSDHKSRGLNLEGTRLTDPERLERLLTAVALAYLWIMEVGALVVQQGRWRQVDNRGARRSVSLCQVGLRWLQEPLYQGLAPPLLSCCFVPVGET